MYYKQFHDLSISALGMGCLRFPTQEGNPNRFDRKAAGEIIDIAMANGINYYDTAYTYQDGDSEIFLGEVLSKYPREQYYLATKYYAACGVDIQIVFEEQLKRCKTDYFDVYMFHGMDENYISFYMDKDKDCLGYLQKQKELGRIRYLGFSSHATPPTLHKFLNWYSSFDMAMIQLNYLDWTLLDAKQQYEILTQHNIPVWVMEPLKGGRLSALNEEATKTLKAAAPDKTISSWGFRYLMGLPNVHTVLSGMSSVEQLMDNIATFQTHQPLGEEENNALQTAISQFMKDLGIPCSSCRYCCKTCPAQLDIPLLMKGYNEKNVSGETWRIAELSGAKGAEHCIQCGVCLSHCPQKINIPQIMRNLSEGNDK